MARRVVSALIIMSMVAQYVINNNSNLAATSRGAGKKHQKRSGTKTRDGKDLY